jgi:C4-dicarboxylate-specific signal transduction histidine kinase
MTNSKDYKFYPSIEEEQELMKQQAKMAAMGEMIGNIAHQWRQPLNALSALNIGLGFKHKKGNLTCEEMEKFKEKSNRIIQNMSATIDDFTNFFKPNKVQEIFKLDDAIRSTIRFVSDSYIENHIKVIHTTSPNIEINSYKNELMQVLLNIFNNSKDAVLEKHIKNPILKISTIQSESEVIIRIQDNAGGISPDILDRVFEPYFTTKFQSQGTGIGLYMSKMIVEKSMKGSLYSENREDGLLTIIKIKQKNIDWSYDI